jgi:hypothetical protein
VIQEQQQCQGVPVLREEIKVAVVMSGRPPVQALRPSGQQQPPVYYGDGIEMSNRVESSDDDGEDPILNFELSWR